MNLISTSSTKAYLTPGMDTRQPFIDPVGIQLLFKSVSSETPSCCSVACLPWSWERCFLCNMCYRNSVLVGIMKTNVSENKKM